MQHLMTLRVYKHTSLGAYNAVFRSEVSNDVRAMVFSERTRAMDYCKSQLSQAMSLSFNPDAKLYMRRVVRKGVWCYNVFGIDRNEAPRTVASVWALQSGGKT